MKSERITRVMGLVCLVMMILSLCFKADWLLVIAAAVMTICVIRSFYLRANKTKEGSFDGKI